MIRNTKNLKNYIWNGCEKCFEELIRRKAEIILDHLNSGKFGNKKLN